MSDASELRRIASAYVLRCFCGRPATHESGRVLVASGRRAQWVRFGCYCPQHVKAERERFRDEAGPERKRVRPLPCSRLIARRVPR